MKSDQNSPEISAPGRPDLPWLAEQLQSKAPPKPAPVDRIPMIPAYRGRNRAAVAAVGAAALILAAGVAFAATGIPTPVHTSSFWAVTPSPTKKAHTEKTAAGDAATRADAAVVAPNAGQSPSQRAKNVGAPNPWTSTVQPPALVQAPAADPAPVSGQADASGQTPDPQQSGVPDSTPPAVAVGPTAATAPPAPSSAPIPDPAPTADPADPADLPAPAVPAPTPMDPVPPVLAPVVDETVPPLLEEVIHRSPNSSRAKNPGRAPLTSPRHIPAGSISYGAGWQKAGQ